MIKLSILMVRRSDLTYEQFIQHWGEVHGPLVAAQSESTIALFTAGFLVRPLGAFLNGLQLMTDTPSARSFRRSSQTSTRNEK